MRETKETEGTQGIVVTTNRGVFFGYGTSDFEDVKRLERARMCVSWSSPMRGVLGLAAIGPDSNCKISWQTPAISLNDVTSVIECTQEAIAAWEKGPWS